MADSTKNYTIKIDTQVTGAQSVQNLGEEVETTGDKFTRLQKQIKDTRVALQQAAETGDTVKFQQLKAQLDDLEDGLEAVNYKSMQLDDQLQQMPGAAGRVGSAMKGLDSVFKLLKANPLLAVIGGVAGIFMGIYGALKKTEEGSKALNKVSEAFGNIITPIIEFISAAAVPVVEAFAKSINFVAKQLGFSTSETKKSLDIDKLKSLSLKELREEYDKQLGFIRAYDKKIKEVNASEITNLKDKFEWLQLLNTQRNEVIKNFNAVAKLIFDQNKQQAEALAEELTISGTRKSEKQKELEFLTLNYKKEQQLLKDGIKDQTLQKESLKRLEIKYQNDRNEIIKKYNRDNEEQKRQDEQKALDRIMFEQGIITEYYLTSLSERNREIYKIEQEYQQTLSEITLDGSEKSYQVLEALTNKKRLDIFNINKKYDDQERQQRQDQYNKALSDTKEQINKQKDLNKQARVDWYNEFVTMSDNTRLDAETRMQAVDEATKREIEIFKEANGVNADNYLRFQNQINAISDAGAKKRAEIAQQEKQKVAEQYAAYSDIAQGFGSLLQDLASLGDESLKANKGLAIAGIIVEKAGSIAQIIANTAIANSKAAAEFPLTLGQPWVGINTVSAGVSIGSTIAAAAKAIQQINGANKNSTSDSGGSATLPAYPSAPTVSAPQVQVAQQNTVGQAVSQTINSTKANKAYVLTSDVTTAQAVDRRIKSNATF